MYCHTIKIPNEEVTNYSEGQFLMYPRTEAYLWEVKSGIEFKEFSFAILAVFSIPQTNFGISSLQVELQTTMHSPSRTWCLENSKPVGRYVCGSLYICSSRFLISNGKEMCVTTFRLLKALLAMVLLGGIRPLPLLWATIME